MGYYDNEHSSPEDIKKELEKHWKPEWLDEKNIYDWLNEETNIPYLKLDIDIPYPENIHQKTPLILSSKSEFLIFE